MFSNILCKPIIHAFKHTSYQEICDLLLNTYRVGLYFMLSDMHACRALADMLLALGHTLCQILCSQTYIVLADMSYSSTYIVPSHVIYRIYIKLDDMSSSRTYIVLADMSYSRSYVVLDITLLDIHRAK